MARDGLGPDDPTGLIHEAYRMEGIGPAECRSIFLDWALGREGDPSPAIERLLRGRPEHPMTDVLRAGLEAPSSTGRRGGRAGRAGRS